MIQAVKSRTRYFTPDVYQAPSAVELLRHLGSKPGMLRNHPLEFMNIPAQILQGRCPPDLHGRLVYNGMGYFAARRGYVDPADGLAKLTSYCFDGTSVRCSSKFIRSSFYEQAMHLGYLPPSIRLGSGGGRSKWSLRNLHKLNYFWSNPSLEVQKVGSRYLACTDVQVSHEIDIETLDTIGPYSYPVELQGDGWIPRLACAQYVCDPGTEEHFNYSGKIHLLTQRYTLLPYRIAKDGTYTFAAEGVTLGYIPLIHSFSVTDSFIIFVIPPERLDLTSLFRTGSINGSVKECRDPTEVLVFDRNTLGLYKRFTIPEAIVFNHTIASRETHGGRRVEIDIFRFHGSHERVLIPRNREDEVCGGIPTRLSLDMDAGTADIAVLSEARGEFPSQPTPHGRIFAMGVPKRGPGEPQRTNIVSVYDGRVWWAPEGEHVNGGPVVAGRYLLFTTTSLATDRFYLYVLDHELSRVFMKAEVPSFCMVAHGTWFA